MVTAKLLHACFFSLKYKAIFLEVEVGDLSSTQAENVEAVQANRNTYTVHTSSASSRLAFF